MSQLKALLSAITFPILMILGAFGLGSICGRAKADKQRADRNVAAAKAAAERRIETTKEASNAQQSVNHMSDDDVDRELHANWTRRG